MALTENQDVVSKLDYMYDTYDVVAGAIHIHRGAILNRDSSGNVKLGSDAASETFAGVAYEELEQASGASAGDNTIKVIAAKSGKVVKLGFTGVTKAEIGLDVYVNGDDQVALAATTTNDVRVGTIVGVAETNYAYVALN